MNALMRRATRAVMQRLPYDPTAIWAELEPDQRAAFRALLELIGGGRELAPPLPPDELLEQFRQAGAAHGVPATLLAAMAWEDSQYDPSAPRGLMGLPGVDVNAAAFMLRRLTDDRGLPAALVKLTGSRERAARVAGTMALLTAARVDAGGVEGMRQLLQLLEE